MDREAVIMLARRLQERYSTLDTVPEEFELVGEKATEYLREARQHWRAPVDEWDADPVTGLPHLRGHFDVAAPLHIYERAYAVAPGSLVVTPASRQVVLDAAHDS
jgi:hypothetical protein